MTALSDVRVLDLSSHIAGPFCSKMLADFGADVIKVEPPGCGDVARQLGPFRHGQADPEASGTFLVLNTNKRGVTLNLETPTGRTLLRQLVAQVDIVVENFPVGTLARLGGDFATLETLRPGLLLTSITPFGQTGPWRDHQATDLVVHAASGASAVNRPPGGIPLKEPGSQTDYQGGACAFLGTMTALCYRDLHGVGQHIEVSLQEAATTMIVPELVRMQYSGAAPGMRIGLLPCKDGHVSINLRSDAAWRDLWVFLGAPEVAEDERFRTMAARRARQHEVEALLCPYLRLFTMEELFHGLQPQRVLVGMTLDMERLVSNPHLQERGFFVEADHPVAGRVAYPGAPFRMSQTPWSLRTPAPLLGQHNEAIYCDLLGYSLQELTAWRSAGII